MDLDYSQLLCFDPDFKLVYEQDNRFLYLDSNNANWFRTNNTGQIILEYFKEGSKSVKSFSKEFSAIYPYSEDTALNVFTKFFLDAIKNGILINPAKGKSISEYPLYKYPAMIWLHLLGECNLKCSYCYSESGPKNNFHLEKEDIISFLSKIPQDFRKDLVISGGEPMLYKDIVTICKDLFELGFKITLITNGTVRHDLYVEIVDYIETIQISFDGSNKEIHDRLRGTGNFEKTIKGLHMAQKIGFKGIVVSFVPTKLNYKDLPNLPTLLEKCEVSAIHISELFYSGRATHGDDELHVEYEEMKGVIDTFISEVTKINRNIEYYRRLHKPKATEFQIRQYLQVSMPETYGRSPWNMNAKTKYRVKNIDCGLGRGTISINYDGSIYPCSKLHFKELSLGNINDEITEILIESEKLARLASVDDADSECYNCNVKYFCSGGCVATGYSRGCTDLKLKNPCCNILKNSIFRDMLTL